MDSFTDSAILIAILSGSFGTALLLQKAALQLMLKAMHRR